MLQSFPESVEHRLSISRFYVWAESVGVLNKSISVVLINLVLVLDRFRCNVEPSKLSKSLKYLEYFIYIPTQQVPRAVTRLTVYRAFEVNFS